MISRIRPHAVTCFCLSLFLTSAIGALCAESPMAVGTAGKVDDILIALKGTGAKVILLNVWSAQCTPCMSELKILSRMSAKHKGNAELAFIGLCLFDSESETSNNALQAASAMVRSKQVTYRNLLWTGRGETLYDRFKIMGTPYTVFISADGKVLGDIVELPEDPEKASEALENGIAKALTASVK